MLNKNLNLKDCIWNLNKMLDHLEDYDCDCECVEYIEVNFEEVAPFINLMIPDVKDYAQYIMDFREDETIDIESLWCEVMNKFNANIWVNFKKRKFYISRWYHGLLQNIKEFKENIGHKIKEARTTHKIKKQYREERRQRERMMDLFK